MPDDALNLALLVLGIPVMWALAWGFNRRMTRVRSK